MQETNSNYEKRNENKLRYSKPSGIIYTKVRF